MQAKDVMTRRVISITPDAPVLKAVRLMLRHRISGLPVVNSAGELQGMITEGDLLRRAETQTERRRPRWLEILFGRGRAATEFAHSHGRKVHEVMSTDPYSITEESSLDDIVSLMEQRQIKRLPVIGDGKLVGIVSRANLLNALARTAKYAPPVTASDTEIREKIQTEMQRTSWAPTAIVDVTVTGSVVEFHGTILDERDRQALIVLAENVPGVKSVVDHLIWLEPYSGIALESGEDVAA